MKNLKNIVLLCVAAVALAACTKTTTIRASNDYQIVVAKAQNISLLPAVVESNSIDAGGKATRNHNYEGQVEEIISDMLVTKLREKGYHVKYINKREIHDLKASKNTFAVQEEYLNQIRALYNPLAMEEKKALDVNLTFSPNMPMSAFLQTDVVVFVEYYMKQKTSGALAKDVVFSALSSFAGVRKHEDPIEDAAESAALRVALIDATSNRLLWSNIVRDGYSAWGSVFGSSSVDKVERKRLAQLLKTLLAPLPDGLGKK